MDKPQWLDKWMDRVQLQIKLTLLKREIEIAQTVHDLAQKIRQEEVDKIEEQLKNGG